MDKNYNVDDILAEIKSRKATQRGENIPTKPKTPFEVKPSEQGKNTIDKSATTSFDFIPKNIDKSDDIKVQPQAKRFEVVIPPADRIGNPMEFDGHVRSIADRAKMRRDRMGKQETKPNEHKTEVPRQPIISEPPKAENVIDFARFRPPSGSANSPEVPQHNISGFIHEEEPKEAKTGRLPKFKVNKIPDIGRSRELKLEDIQQMDFNAVAKSYNEFEYEEEPDEQNYESPGIPADLSEYNSVADRGAVSRDIAKVKFWLRLRCAVTALLTAMLFYYTLAGKNPWPLLDILLPETNMRMYMIGLTAISILVALVCSSAVGSGIISLFKMRSNSDTLTALALLAAIGQNIAGVANPSSISPADMGLYSCVASLSMLFNCIGKTSMINRIQANFNIISSNEQKRVVLPVTSNEFLRKFANEVESLRPTITYSAKSDFFTDFLALSYSDKYDVGIYRSVAPVCFIGSIIISVLTYMLTQNSATALAAITAILCVSATFSATFIENIPLGKLTKKLAPRGGMVSGNKAIETFCDTNAVILRESDLFPDGNIQVHGIKAYSHGRVDEAILDAASVICSIDSALSPVFLQMICGNKNLLKKVDNIVYENNMGISAWVNSRRVLIGNRKLMENHGIPVPSSEYAQKYSQENGEAIYLSNSGEICAQFIVSYHIDAKLASSLDSLSAHKKRITIYTMDPNITAHKLWEIYGYPEDLIEIMPADMHTNYEEMSKPKQSATAEIVYSGNASCMVDCIIACTTARSSILAATIVQLFQIILGYGFVAFCAFMGVISAVNISKICIYQLFWFLAIYIIQKARGS